MEQCMGDHPLLGMQYHMSFLSTQTWYWSAHIFLLLGFSLRRRVGHRAYTRIATLNAAHLMSCPSDRESGASFPGTMWWHVYTHVTRKQYVSLSVLFSFFLILSYIVLSVSVGEVWLEPWFHSYSSFRFISFKDPKTKTMLIKDRHGMEICGWTFNAWHLGQYMSTVLALPPTVAPAPA